MPTMRNDVRMLRNFIQKIQLLDLQRLLQTNKKNNNRNHREGMKMKPYDKDTPFELKQFEEIKAIRKALEKIAYHLEKRGK